ncbi:MAG TPA: MarR family transcriptional regulator [Firmicutes bacterium]|jgi:MarR family transcriptional regulator, organic hydroperoxide resistance regulator|nr:MarR family transcriptional regulator [Bacillota bacterium]
MKSEEELRYLVLAAQREGSRMLSELLKPLGITTSQSEVLRVLYDYESLSLIELGELLVCETGSPSRLVTKLVDAGLVEQKRSKEDSRKVKLTLTLNGRNLVPRIIAAEEKLHASINTSLNGAPVQQFIDLLWKQVEGKPAGKALVRRKTKKTERGNHNV